MLECTAWDAPRHQLWQGITDVAGAAEVKRVQALPPAEQVGAHLRTHAHYRTGWGGCAGLVNAQVQRFLAAVYVSLHSGTAVYGPGGAGRCCGCGLPAMSQPRP